MKKKTDHPGVYPPPPLFYVVTFFLSIFPQSKFPLPTAFFNSRSATITGFAFIGVGALILLPALMNFLRTKNTLITIKPANSLQTIGVFAISRNPMYLGLLSLYIGIAFFKGSYWTFILIPFVIFVVTYFVIIKEEKYLSRAFGASYDDYKKKVRRWI
jgi:protein-S-isoprenylcysteine O-methyltransferase Ste14